MAQTLLETEESARVTDGLRDHRLFMLWTLLRQTYTLVLKNQDRKVFRNTG
jgi:hypothetical protein